MAILGLFHHGQQLFRGHLDTLGDGDLGDRSVNGRDDRCFHLHGFDHQDDITLLDGGADRFLDAQHQTGQLRLDLRSGSRSGGSIGRGSGSRFFDSDLISCAVDHRVTALETDSVILTVDADIVSARFSSGGFGGLGFRLFFCERRSWICPAGRGCLCPHRRRR